MNLDIFKTPKHLPFIYYFGCPDLHTGVGDFSLMKQPSVDDLWPVMNMEPIENHSMRHFIAAKRLMNEVGRKTRRACANIIFVPNDMEKALFDSEFPSRDEVKIVVDTSLQPDELRATYWELTSSDKGGCVDGGIQISPEGFSAIRKHDPAHMEYHHNIAFSYYQAYFIRCFL